MTMALQTLIISDGQCWLSSKWWLLRVGLKSCTIWWILIYRGCLWSSVFLLSLLPLSSPWIFFLLFWLSKIPSKGNSWKVQKLKKSRSKLRTLTRAFRELQNKMIIWLIRLWSKMIRKNQNNKKRILWQDPWTSHLMNKKHFSMR